MNPFAWIAGACWLLSGVGLLLAVTFAPGAAAMGIGAAIVAAVFTVIAVGLEWAVRRY